jgi:5-methylcytosine-specific restriction endonuclease McrA
MPRGAPLMPGRRSGRVRNLGTPNSWSGAAVPGTSEHARPPTTRRVAPWPRVGTARLTDAGPPWVLARDPVCRACGKAPSTVADHIQRIREGGARFDLANGQGLCSVCHDAKRGREAPRGDTCPPLKDQSNRRRGWFDLLGARHFRQEGPLNGASNTVAPQVVKA